MNPIKFSKKLSAAIIAAVILLTGALCYVILRYSLEDVAETVRLEVESFDELASASESAGDGERIVIKGSFALESDIEFCSLVSFDFERDVDFADCTIFVRSEKDGKAVVTLNEVSADGIIYDCPSCDLIIKGDDAPDIYSATLKMNIRSYNGEAVSRSGLGGSGKARITALRMTAADNGWLADDVEFEVGEKLIIGKMPYLASGYGIRHARIEVEADGEWKSLNCDNGDGSFNLCGCAMISVSDGNESYNYRVMTEREPFSIPVIYIDTENAAEVISKEEYINASLTIDSAGYKGFDSVDFCNIEICGRGNSSWEFPKTPYKIKFASKTSVFGLSAAEDYALFPNYADKSLMRNRVALEMARLLSFDYTPTQYPVDVFVNGEYVGVYTFGEHLETGEGRVEIFPELGVEDTDYFIEVGGVESGENFKGYDYFHAGLIKFALIKAPMTEYMTDDQFRFIRQYFADADKAVTGGGNYTDYLDMSTLVDWLIMTELTNNTDSAFRRSCYFTKKAGEKLKMGPVWDHDLAFGNFTRDDKDYSTWATSTDDEYVGTTWSTYLFEDENFMKLFTARWDAVKDSLVEKAFEVADETAKDIYRSQEYNFTVWNILSERVKFERNDIVQYATFEQQVMYLEDFLEERYKWIDQKLEAYRKKP